MDRTKTKKEVSKIEKKLLYRRQFILSDRSFGHFDHWNTLEIGHDFVLSAHPDLKLTEALNSKVRLILLGYILDPFTPQMSNKDVLNDLMSHVLDFDGLINSTEKYSGRWIIIYQDDDMLKMIHDPCGQRHIYYYTGNQHTTCASDPSLMDYFFHTTVDTSSELQEVLQSDAYKAHGNSCMVNNTRFIDVKHLLPNHYLNVLNKKAVRFWPIKSLKKESISDAATLGAKIIKGTMEAASRRQKLALAVTSGVDSRILLASSKDIKEKITYYINVPRTGYENLPDVLVPNRLLKKIDLSFCIRECSSSIPESFKTIYKRNVKEAIVEFTHLDHIYQNYMGFQDKLTVNGNNCEIVRKDASSRPLIHRKATATSLSRVKFIKQPGSKYVEKHIQSWLTELRSYETSNINLFDLAYWELHTGNWGSLYPAEQDIAVDQLSPFNNRLFFRLMMSVDIKHRILPNYKVFHEMIKLMWPELLKEPINPRRMVPFLRTKGRHLIIKYSNGYRLD